MPHADDALIPNPAASLRAALVANSARLSPPPTPWRSVAIHGAVLLLWVALFSMAFTRGGLLAWSVGGAYIAYDTLLLFFVGWNTLRLLAPAPAVAAAARPRVGVIVAAHDEAAVLPVTIAALLAQTDPPEQIVIADDGSSDGHRPPGSPPPMAWRRPRRVPLSAASVGEPSLRWHRNAWGGKAKALNAAIERIDTEVVLTVDADTLLERHAIAAVRQAFAAEAGLVAITGVITPLCKPTAMGRCLEWFQTYEYIRNFLSRYAWMQVDSLLLISGAFAGFRRQAVLPSRRLRRRLPGGGLRIDPPAALPRPAARPRLALSRARRRTGPDRSAGAVSVPSCASGGAGSAASCKPNTGTGRWSAIAGMAGWGF